MISFLKLIRYKNLLMVLLTLVLTKYALIDSFIEVSFLSNFQFSILAFSIVCITAGGYIINDVFDIKADKINKPNKAFVSNIISKKNALNSYYLITSIGVLLGIALSVFINKPIYSLIFIITSFSLYAYSSLLKRKPFVGNILVSIFISIAILTITIFDNIFYNKGIEVFALLIYINAYMLFSFLTTLIREIIKDIEDINGDLKIKAKTLPIVLGRKRANRIAIGLSILLIVFLIIVFKLFLVNYHLFLGYSVVFIITPLLYFLYKLWDAETKNQYSYLSNLMKMIMFFGILSMLFFKFL